MRGAEVWPGVQFLDYAEAGVSSFSGKIGGPLDAVARLHAALRASIRPCWLHMREVASRRDRSSLSDPDLESTDKVIFEQPVFGDAAQQSSRLDSGYRRARIGLLLRYRTHRFEASSTLRWSCEGGFGPKDSWVLHVQMRLIARWTVKPVQAVGWRYALAMQGPVHCVALAHIDLIRWKWELTQYTRMTRDHLFPAAFPDFVGGNT